MIDLDSLFKLSYGMYIVSSRKELKFNGCIVNTAFQLIPGPPMIVASINIQSLTREYIMHSKVFTISVLAEDTPMPFIGRFGFRTGKDIEKFENVNFKIGKTGIPLILENTIAFVEAEVIDSINVETHTLFIAKIVACEIFNDSKPPLTYAYYRDVKHGRTPKSAATYHEQKQDKKIKGNKTMKKYQCTLCSYIYDPEIGDPDNGVEPGTAFEDIPDSWTCPECGASKDDFELVED